MRDSIVCFDEYELDLNSHELQKSGRAVKLEKLPTELLILLVEKQGQLVTREEIILRLWGDNVFVDTRQGINTAIRKIRVALHDDPDKPRLLQTIAGMGYRLLAPVSRPAIRSDPRAETLSPTVGTRAANAEEPPAKQPPVLPSAVSSDSSSLTPVRHARIWAAAIFLILLVSAGLWFSRKQASEAVPEQQPVQQREQRVTSNPPEAPITAAVISPDGKYVAYSDPAALYLRHIATGETHPWNLPKDFVAIPNSWFPDGTHLLVMRFEGPARTPSLWKLSLLGAAPRKLIDHAAGGSVSPDGNRIAFLVDWGHELWVMESDGANPHKLAAASTPEPTSRGSWIFPVVWSPNGKRLAYIECHGVMAPDPAEDTFSLRTLDTAGGDLQVVLNDTRLTQAIGWAADGRVFYGYREDAAREQINVGLRAIRVDESNGKSLGKPEWVTHGVGRIGGLSITTDGKRLALWRVNTGYQAFLTEVDSRSGLLKSPRRLTMDTNTSLVTAWTPDSKSVLFVSNRTGTWTLFRQAIDEATPEVLVSGRSIFLPRMSADGSQVLYESYIDPQNTALPVDLMRIPVAGGGPQLVLRQVGITNYQCARYPSTVCLLSTLQGPAQVYASFDLIHGIGHELLRTANGFSNWSLSPDGKKLAIFVDPHTIRFFALDPGAHETGVVKLNDWAVAGGDWAADGNGLLTESVTPGGTPVILRVNESGTITVSFEGAGNTSFWAAIPSPDGRYVIANVAVADDNNIWMMNNP